MAAFCLHFKPPVRGRMTVSWLAVGRRVERGRHGAAARGARRALTCAALAAAWLAAAGPVFAQAPPAARPGVAADPTPSPATQQKIDALIGDVIEAEAVLHVDLDHSKLVRMQRPVTRVSITDPEVVEVVQFSPQEFELIGNRVGETTATLWFQGADGRIEVLRYIVRVSRTGTEEEQRRAEYGDLEERLRELFPNSLIQLIPISNKLIVRGQARDANEAAQILAILRGQSTDQTGRLLGPGALVDLGPAAPPTPESDLPASNIISLLSVPGEMQVLLKVRVAELSRTALRAVGSEFQVLTGDFELSSLLGLGGGFTALLNDEDVRLSLQATSSNGYGKILAEPNLVTLSGRPAFFIAGGEFAVPTVVGVDGVGAATTSFRGFGTQVRFTPTVLDKDLIRLEVAPSFSTINQSLAVDGIPGLNSRAVATTVDMRQGQWLAIAGLIQDQQAGDESRVPFIGDLPILDILFSRRHVAREETELVILVGPELVHPLEENETPLVLPGMEVTEPGDIPFFFGGRYEGRAGCDVRSTLNPIQRDRLIDAWKQATVAARRQVRYQKSEGYYVLGQHGFSE